MVRSENRKFKLNYKWDRGLDRRIYRSCDVISVVDSVKKMKKIIERYRKTGQTIGFVPTMGYLHEGHLSLVEGSREDCDITVVSIFVNPTQFTPGEDLERYPRDLEGDLAKLESLHVDILFHPQSNEIYPHGYDTYVHQDHLTRVLCGKSRPTHFQGVLTVCLKLFQIVRPHQVYFGQKDLQQCAVIRRMVRDFHLPIKVRVLPIYREEDGLAMSSRNKYMSEDEREVAPQLQKSIQLAKKLIAEGERRSEVVIEKVRGHLSQFPEITIDYVDIIRGDNLQTVEEVGSGHYIALAAWVGEKARLLDNGLLME